MKYANHVLDEVKDCGHNWTAMYHIDNDAQEGDDIGRSPAVKSDVKLPPVSL